MARAPAGGQHCDRSGRQARIRSRSSGWRAHGWSRLEPTSRLQGTRPVVGGVKLSPRPPPQDHHRGGRTRLPPRGPLVCPSQADFPGSRGRRAVTRRPPCRLPQGAEGRPELLREQLGLFPGGEVAASVEPVVVDEVVRVGALGPAPGSLVQLVGEHADGERYGDGLGIEEARVVLPIEASRGDPGVGQPIEGDVVEEVVSREAVECPLQDLGDQAGLTGPVAVVEHEGREIDR